MQIKKVILMSILLAILVMPYAAINYTTPVKAQQEQYDYEAELTIPLGWWLDVLNPTESTTAYDWDILGWLFPSFYVANPWNWTDTAYDIPLMLTEKPTFEVVTDSQYGQIGRWTLHFRDDIVFFDGTPLTADDVVFTYDFLLWLAPESDAWTDLPYFVINATKVDDYTVYVYTWDTGFLYALYGLTQIVFPKHIYEREETWGIEDDNNFDTFPVWNATPADVVGYTPQSPDDPILTGYGPFKIASWSGATFDTSDVIVLERNPTYFDRAIDEQGNVVHKWAPMTPDNLDLKGPYVKRLIYKVIIEPSALVQALLAGEIDMAAEFEFGAYIDQFIGYNIAYAPRLGFGHISINCKSSAAYGLLQDARFRRALAFAIDKREVIDVAWYGYAEPLDVPVPKAMGDWSIEYTGEVPGPSYYDHNPSAALELLNEIGIKDVDGDGWLEYGNDPSKEIELEIIATESTTVRRIVSTAAASIRAIGIKVTEVYGDFRALLNAVIGGTFELTFFGFGLGRFPTFLYSFTSAAGDNFFIWRWYPSEEAYTYWNVTYNISYDEAVNNMLTAANPDDAKVWAREAEKVLYWEQPIIPIYQNIIIGVWNGTEWKGIVGEVAGAPVVNFYSIMKAVKVQYRAAAGGIAFGAEMTWIAIGVAVIVIVAAIAVIARRGAPAA